MTVAGVLAACSNSNTGSSSSKQVMNTATSNEISTLDSSKYGDTTSSEALQNVFTILTKITALNLQGQLA